MKESLTAGVEQSSSTKPNSIMPPQKATQDISLNLRRVSEIYKTVKQDIRERTGEIKYPFGLTELDDKTFGVHRKQLLTIGAMTSHGKSAFAVNLSKNLADRNNKVIYFSLEMSVEQLVERLVTNLCDINNIQLRKGTAFKELEEKESIFLSWADSAKLLIEDVLGYKFENIVKVIEALKPDFVILDYIQMISTFGHRSKLEAIEEYIRKLKQLSIEYNFGAIVLSQLNRTAKEEFSMSKLKWAGVLEEHSDTVLLLKYDWEKSQYDIRIEKQRHGVVGNLKVKFLPEFSRFEDLSLKEKAKIEQETIAPPIERKDW